MTRIICYGYFIPLVIFLSGLGCRPKAIPTLFTTLDAATTGVDFVNRVPDQTADGMNIIQYLYYYNGGGAATGDLNNDGLADLFFTSNLEQNRLYLNQGNFQFKDATTSAGVGGTPGAWNTGVALVDINADGWLDIYVCRVGQYKKWLGKNQLFVNQKDGTFKDEAAAYGLDISAFCTQAAFFDYDLDGDLDCFLTCHSVHSSGSYRDTSLTRKYDPLAADRLLERTQNDKNTLSYRDISQKMGIYGGTAGYGLGLAIGDINNDGYPDIYVTNDFHENDYCYINRAGRHFDECISTRMGHTSNFSMGCDLADINNDTRPDLITLDMKPEDEFTLKASQPADPYDIYLAKHAQGYHWQIARNALQINTSSADKQWSEIAYQAGVAATDWSWSPLFADFDLDGWRDLHITNGIVRRPNDMDYLKFISSADVQRNATDLQLIEKMPSGAVPNYCFRNQTDGTFEDVSALWGLNKKGCSNGSSYADLDNDGDLDLVTNNINEAASVYRNEAVSTTIVRPEKQPVYWLKIRLQGDKGNTFGIGAKLWLKTETQTQYIENQPIRGFQSCVEPGVMYFGAQKDTATLLIQWPGGETDILPKINLNQTVSIKKGAFKAAFPVDSSAKTQPFFVEKRYTPPFDLPAPETARVEWTGRWLSLWKPPVDSAMASADFDGDGVQDRVYGAEWQPVTIDYGGQDPASITLPETGGFWFHFSSGDLDGDGDQDIVAGNLGLNSILRASADMPLERWEKDFDNNGQKDPIIAYYRQGKQYVFWEKDLLINQLPMLRKRFIQYRKYAESTFDQVIDRDMQRGATVQKIALLTSCWLENKGNRQWVVHQLPGTVQCAPVCAALVHDFNHDGHADLLLGGNIYQVQPSIGRLDASHGLVLLGNGKGQFQPAPDNLGFWVNGEIRKLEWDAAQGVVVTLADGGIHYFTML